MGRYNFRAQRIHDTVSGLLSTGMIERKPAWYDVVGAVRPPELLTRRRPLQHPQARTKQQKLKKGGRMFQPTEISYAEDELRYTFFKDHPWELARPRIVTEETGINNTEAWHEIRQSGKQLNGESVVQRQMFLMDHVNLTESQAYDVARSEFYAERLKEQVERRVAREEATHYGAFFGKNRLEIGMQLEDSAFEEWKAWAGAEVTKAEQARVAGNTTLDSSDSANNTNEQTMEEGNEQEEEREGRRDTGP